MLQTTVRAYVNVCLPPFFSCLCFACFYFQHPARPSKAIRNSNKKKKNKIIHNKQKKKTKKTLFRVKVAACWKAARYLCIYIRVAMKNKLISLIFTDALFICAFTFKNRFWKMSSKKIFLVNKGSIGLKFGKP